MRMLVESGRNRFSCNANIQKGSGWRAAVLEAVATASKLFIGSDEGY